MREYVLTDLERAIAKEFLKTGKKLDGFSVLRRRIERSLETLDRDLGLAKKFYEKVKHTHAV